MDQKQADQIIDFVYGMLYPPDKELTRLAWRVSLAPLDPTIAGIAVINGLQVWDKFPQWPRFMVEYHAVARRRTPNEAKEKIECATCIDHGLVYAYGRYDRPSLVSKQLGKPDSEKRVGPFEEWAPCPHCERGKRIEVQQYGDSGYWQGQDTSGLRPVVEEEGLRPDWVKRWETARSTKLLSMEPGKPSTDMRPFPQQYDALTAEERPKKSLSDASAWVQEEEYAGEGHA